MIKLKSPQDIEIMAEGGRLLAKILESLGKEVKVGIKTSYLDNRARILIGEVGAEAAFLGYRPGGAGKPYPAAVCVSVNEVVVHGLPSNYRIKDGDLVKIDLGIKFQGFFLDSAITIGVGHISSKSAKLIKITSQALDRAINEAKIGKTLGDIGWVVEDIAKRNDFSVVKVLTGHGIGRQLHEDPNVYNFGRRGEGMSIKEGMVLAIEPMIASSPQGGDVVQAKDDSFVTSDKSLSAHFEHTVAITKNGPRVLTKSSR